MKMFDLSTLNIDVEKNIENNFMLQLKASEELNANLVKLVEKGKRKLNDVRAANNKFVSIIAHDLRGPFSSILLALELLKEKLDVKNITDFENYINIATDSTNRALSLLENLLTWTISQNIKANYNPVKINLCEIIEDEIKNNQIQVNRKQIELSHTISQDLNVKADLQMLKTIIRNLIGNAIKYTNTSGKVRISASTDYQFVNILIIDNGVGISSEVQQNLFRTDSFHSTQGTYNEKGTGLGLLLCKEFIELHGGNISVISAPEKGSKIKFTLPNYI